MDETDSIMNLMGSMEVLFEKYSADTACTACVEMVNELIQQCADDIDLAYIRTISYFTTQARLHMIENKRQGKLMQSRLQDEV